jgi:hypothetical protein
VLAPIDSTGGLGKEWRVVKIWLQDVANGGNVKNGFNVRIFGALAIAGVGLMLTGCKPDLTQANAQALIQAKYDQMPPQSFSITISQDGLKQGATAKYWTMTKLYPNKFWADFTLTPDGKKAVKLPNGGDVIEWRPDSLTDTKFTVVVMTVASNHLKAKDVKPVQDEAIGKSAEFTEAVNLEGVPAPLQEIAHNPGNKLSTKRQADFTLDGGAWKLGSVN